MKKITILILSLIVMISVSSCKKDSINEDDEFVLQPVPEADGVFNPMMKIANVTGDNINEDWTWTNDQLTAIQYQNVSSTISYNGNQMSEITMSTTDATTNTQFTYNNNQLIQVKNSLNNTNAVNLTLQHNANNKISYADIQINQTYATSIFNQLFDQFFNKHTKGTYNPNAKIDIENATGKATLNWNGNNMNKMIANFNTKFTITAGEIKQMLENIDPSILGNYASIIDAINLLPNTTALPIKCTINDTTNYTFDNKNNPYYGFLCYELETSEIVLKGLSQNNVLTSQTNNGVIVTIHIPLLGDQSIPIPLPSYSQSYQYQYNAKGFPTEVTSNKNSYTITYK